MLKGKPNPPEKARWILAKLELVRAQTEEDIVTGSRIPYLGWEYYTEVYFDPQLEQVEIEFNHSRFRIHVNPGSEVQLAIKAALDS